MLSATLFQFRRRYGIDVMRHCGECLFYQVFLQGSHTNPKALALGHWIIGGQMLLAEDWHPTASLSSSNVHPLWLTLPNLPSILRSRKSLIAITSFEFDLDTAKCSKLAHPRLRVHVDISVPVKLGTWFEFEFGFAFDGLVKCVIA